MFMTSDCLFDQCCWLLIVYLFSVANFWLFVCSVLLTSDCLFVQYCLLLIVCLFSVAEFWLFACSVFWQLIVCLFSVAGFQLVLARKVSFYIITFYLPSGLFVVISWISFLVNPECIPGRMSLLITIFLVLINIFNTIQTNSPQVKRITVEFILFDLLTDPVWFSRGCSKYSFISCWLSNYLAP